MELTHRTRKMKLEPEKRLERIGRIMVNRRFRFHTAHVRSVRITVRHQLILLRTGSVS